MRLSEKQLSHPRMPDIIEAVNSYIAQLCADFDITRKDMEAIENHSNRIHDELAAYVLRAYRVNHSD